MPAKRLSCRRYQRFFEGNAFISRQDRLADTDQAVTVTHGGWNMGNLITSRLALLDRSPHAMERLMKKRLNIMGLKAAGIGTLHILANSVNTTCVHSIVDEGVVFK